MRDSYRKGSCLTAVVCLTWLAASTQAAHILIDTMDDAPQTLSTSTSSIGSASSILGGNRYVHITNNNGEGTVSANVANATQPDGLLGLGALTTRRRRK